MLSPRRAAQLGLFAAAAVMLSSLAALIYGSTGVTLPSDHAYGPRAAVQQERPVAAGHVPVINLERRS
jgi:hypothetical protein